VKQIDARTGLEVMDRAECLGLLADDEIGRLALVVHGVPAIFPVNYALDGEDIVIRTDPGTKLDATGRAPACFEVDRFDRSARTGWSVVATGFLVEVSPFDAPARNRLRALDLHPWASGTKAHWLRLTPGDLTGRRVRG
jgi:nitroimidazol reductase NimA-like FMN-containing flavoprotein (pyridoxamine 5'-phosphate oxidase superfamily)